MFRGTNDLAYGRTTSLSLHRRAKGNLSFIQRLKLEATLSVHNGCVNTMCWNDSGSLILSGSDDQYLKITDPFNRNVVTSVHSGHRANIFSAKFLPNSRDSQIVSCSGDGTIFHTDIERTDATGSHLFNCHFGTTYEVLTMPQDCHTFLSCGEDGTVRWFDLRIKSSCNKDDCKEDVLINCSRAVTSLAINPCTPYELAVGCSDSTIRIFDRRMLGTAATGNFSGRSITGMLSRFSAPPLENRSHRITSLVYSSDGEELLTNYSSEHLYLFNLKMDGRKLKEFTTDAKDSAEGESPNNSAGSLQPPVKRLRLRGDWSDTGPGARPERERADQEDQVAVTIMQRMSDMLSRWLEGASRQSQRPPEHSTDEQAQAAVSETDNATLSRQSSSMQSAAATTSSAQTDSQAPSASQDPDSPRDTSERCSNQANETKSGSGIEASTRSLGSQCGLASSRTVVGPSGAGAREMVCRLAKQLTCDLDTAPESGQVRGEGEETARNNSSKVTHGGVEMETATSSAKVFCEDAGDLRECEVEHDAGVPCVAVNNDSVMSASYDIDLDETACGSKQEVSLPRDTDRHVTDRRTDQPMEAASHESELGNVKGQDLTADGSISDDDLSTHKLPLTPSDVTIEWASNESKCRDSEILTDNVRSDINLEANNVTEKMTTTSVDVMEDKTACDTESLSTIDPVDSAKEEQADGPVVGRSSSGNESSHVPERPQQLPSEVASVRHMIEPSPSDLQPVISLHYCTEGTSSSTIRIDFEALSESQHLLVEERQRTHAETPGESDTSHATATMKNDQLQDGTTSRSQSTQQAREKVPQDDTTSQSEARDIAVGGEPVSDVNTELNMSTGSAVSSDSDMSVSSRGDNPPREDETADGKGGGIQEQPHKQLASDSSSSDDREKLVKLCNPRARDPSMSVDLLANVKSEVGLDQTDAATEGTSMQTSSTMESDNPNHGQTSEESYGRRSSLPTTAMLETQRHQRPTGHTGPSSGVSRLFSSVDDDDDDDDDDVRLMGGTRNTQSRSYMRDDEAERNRAASHLQRLYRQRQAARDMDELEMKKLPQPMVKRVFKGHRNSRTMIKQANFWGDDYVMCGSDCGHIFVWDRTTARLAMLLEADKHVVNCVQPHPYDPILASSGIDYNIKIWSPLSTEACFDEQAAEEIMRRNDVMLEETRDTITVPASFMLRMLASLNHFRGARGTRVRRVPNDTSSSSSDDS